MYPTVIIFGRFNIDSYTLLLDAGLILVYYLLFSRARRAMANPARWLDGVVIGLAAGVLGARLAYVIANWSYFQEKQSKILKFWLGGLSWHGALVGVLLALVVYCWLRRISLLRFANEIALVAPIIGVFASTGCLMAGCAYGREVFEPQFLAAELPDLFGVWSYRYNVQLYGAAWSLLVFVILAAVKKHLPLGGVAALYLLLTGVGFARIDSLRGDIVPVIGQWRLDSLLDIFIAIAGALLFLVVIMCNYQVKQRKD
ncbi:MAG: prolipoprotein diacylglyceryl transferase [Anaerolineales bacterium]|nr:prolipoprotein diacylglyceryl transferase [Anaerolineales bacterium]